MIHKITRPSLLPFLLLSLWFGPGWKPVAAQSLNQFDWIRALPGEPLGMALDGQRNTYVLTKGNTLVQFSATGQERWRQTYADWPELRTVTVDAAGNLLLAGTFKEKATIGSATFRLENSYDISTFLVKLDSLHSQRWATHVAGNDNYMVNVTTLSTDTLGQIHVLGSRNAGPLLVTFDENGIMLRKNALMTHTFPTSLAADAPGNTFVTLTQSGSSSSYGVLQRVLSGTVAWSRYLDEGLNRSATNAYNTTAVQLRLDTKGNSYGLGTYELLDKSSSRRLESGQTLVKYDPSGNLLWQKSGPSVPDSATAAGLLVDPAGMIITYGGYAGKPVAGTFPPTLSNDDYISLAGYSPAGELRWKTRYNSPDGNDQLFQVDRDAHGALLLLGSTSGNLTLGSQTIAGKANAPVYYLTKLQPATLRTEASLKTLCAGTTTSAPGAYQGYFESEIEFQLSDGKGSFAQPTTVGRVPVGVPGEYFNGPATAPRLTLPAAVQTGASYRLRAVTSLPVYQSEPLTVSVAKAPTPPTVGQQGDELVAATTGATQWFTVDNQAVANANSPRFRPTQSGQYYAVSVADGCQSLPSELLNYVITATEFPTSGLITVSPNPASERVRVDWKGVGAGKLADVRLFDATGRLLRTVSRSHSSTEVDLQGLPSGLYLVVTQVDGLPVNSQRLLVR